MCGIAGFLGGFKPALLEDFCERLAHRGPDGYGVWKDAKAGVGLAHRRLSIIDLSNAASQPMQAVDGRYVVTFNGEIYNYQSLVPVLRAQGYAFNEHSDTAVLAPLYDLYGEGMMDKLEGMFAFAIWDREKGELFCARDHAGIKPFYYANSEKGLVFASELKALAGVEGLERGVDAHGLAEYLTFLWTPSERTMVRGVKKLRPGHWLRARAGKGGVKLEGGRWYAPPQAPLTSEGPAYDGSKTAEGLRDVFDAVVKEQCVSDVPVGAFLSGGVDSSAIVASMAASGVDVAGAYCISFAGAGMASEGFGEDIDYAREVAERYDIMLSEVRVDAAGVLGRLPGLAELLDEPTADPAPLFVEDIARAARSDGLKLLMSGTGGDDVMSGYRRHVTARLRQRLGALRHPAAAMLQGAAKMLPQGAKQRRAGRLARLLGVSEERFLREAFMTNSQPDAWELLHPDLRAQVAAGWHTDLDLAAEESAGQDLVNRLLYAELFGFLPDHNLNYGDKASMAAGVEVRVPFTDRRLLAWMADVDPAVKMRGFDAKAMFKESQKERLPERVLTRSKSGFGAPIRSWLVGDGRALVEDTLMGGQAEWFDAQAVQDFWRRTREGKVDGAYTVLALCMACWWQGKVK
ncbi:MAG: asparagine synthase (glutamine-hydrolyzing) [Proteobacteria bacterium]|nr:asparagine synthase (glutamine-hydrolyzing) [Pseudomonadota bacterium]